MITDDYDALSATFHCRDEDIATVFKTQTTTMIAMLSRFLMVISFLEFNQAFMMGDVQFNSVKELISSLYQPNVNMFRSIASINGISMSESDFYDQVN